MRDAHLIVYERAYLFLAQFLDPAPAKVAARLSQLLSLRPQPDDYARVFTAEAVEPARTVYEALWAAPQPLSPTPDQTMVELQVASGLELQTGSGAAAEFPGGYAEVAHLFRPEPYWVCWRFGAPHQRGAVFYDGLVALDERLIWLPKPWRALPPRSPTAFAVAGHFDD